MYDAPLTLPSGPTSTWDQALYAFLVEKGNRSGSGRTVQSYSRMLWPFFDARTPEVIRPADVLAFAHGIGPSGRPPSSATIGARIACLSSYYRFLIRMDLVRDNPCDAVERPRTITAPARGYSAMEVRRLLAIFGRLEVLGFQRMEFELTPDAIDLGMDAAIRGVIELGSKVDEFGRGERI